MKYRCACGKPEQYETHTKSAKYGATIIQVPGNTLHFKAADRECERCGRPLCSKCGTMVDREVESMFYKGLMVCVVDFLCPICAEVI